MATTQAPVSLNDLLTAMNVVSQNALQATAPAKEESGIAKHASTVIVAVILALCLWVGASVYTLNTTTTQVATKLDGMQKTLDEVSSRQDQTANRMADMQAAQAGMAGRVTALEQGATRQSERIRVLEGQQPITGKSM